MTLSEDKMFYQMRLGEAQRIAFEVFGVEDFSVEVFPDGTFDEAEQVYKVSAESDVWSSKFDCSNIKVTVDGLNLDAYIARIYAECKITDDEKYGVQDYGTYIFTFEQMESENGAYLRLIGVKKQ